MWMSVVELMQQNFRRTLVLVANMILLGGQQTLEDPEKPWILFTPGKIPWKALKLHSTLEKLCSEAYFPCINLWPCSAVAFLISVMQGRRIYEVIGE